MKTITSRLPLAIGLALGSVALPALAAERAQTDTFTVLQLQAAPAIGDATALTQLRALQPDAIVLHGQVQDAAVADPTQALADALGYQLRFVSGDEAALATRSGDAVLTRLPISAESGPSSSTHYLRLIDGTRNVALYAGRDATALSSLIAHTQLQAPAVLLGTSTDVEGFTAVAAKAAPDGVAYSGAAFAGGKPQAKKVKLGGKATGTLLTLPFAAPAGGRTPWMDASLSPGARADALVSQLTLDEKFQMINSIFGLGKDGGPKPEGAIGAAGYTAAIERLGIPAQHTCDAGLGVTNPGNIRPGDVSTAMPSGPATASTWNPAVAWHGGATMGREAWQQHCNILLAGSLNLQRDPRNGRNFEYLGEDPLLAGTLAGRIIGGVQSQHVVSTMKHYALNDMETTRNTHSADIGEQAMRESDLLGFELAYATGRPGSVMCAYNKINGTYACEHDGLLNGVLKQEWKFPGYVMSDWGGVHSAAKSALAGLDQQSAGETFDKEVYFDKPLRKALAEGEVPQARIDDMVRRILHAFFANGVFDKPTQHQPIDVQAGFASAQQAAEEGIVLLRNEGQVLPLSRQAKRVVVIGGHADKGVIGGGGSSMVGVTARGQNAVPGLSPTTWPGPVIVHPTPPVAALQALLPQAKVEYLDGKNPAAAAKVAKGADAVIVFATQWIGESVDLPDMALPDGQDALIGAVAKANANTVVVLETNGPVRMPWASQVPAVLEAWYGGIRGGEAIANVLTGQVNPSGRLPVSWAVDETQLPRPSLPGLGFKPKDTPFLNIDYDIEGANAGYKWFAAKGLKPRYAFGYGLSYTQFGYDNLQVSVEGQRVVASFDIRNNGVVAGADVPQLYVTLPDGHATPLRLVGWQKVTLQPGEQRRVRIEAEPKTLADFDTTQKQWKIAAGRYTLSLSRAAGDPVKTETVELREQVLPGFVAEPAAAR